MGIVIKGVNDLATTHPDIAKQCHPMKNGELNPSDVTAGSNKKVWWLLSYDDPNTGKHFDFEWEAIIADRVRGKNCPYLSGHQVYKGFNDLATLHPDIAKEWHPTKNGDLTPSGVTAGSHQKVWWLLHYDDPNTGNHFDFEWEAAIYSRAQGNKCPYISGKAVYKGFNDLATTHPEIAKEWHPTKNGTLTPSDVVAGSNKKVWWLLSYDDPDTGKHFDFEWKTTIAHRVQGIDCPYISGKAVYKGFNDLETLYPEIAKEWHPTRNGALTPSDVTAGSGKKVWWLLPYDDPETEKHFDFEWEATIDSRVRGCGCPYLEGHCVVYKGYNDLETLYPDIAKEWHPTKNGGLLPSDVTSGSNKKVWWLLPYDDPNTGKHFDFEWKAEVADRVQGRGCPYLSIPAKAVYKGFNDLATTHPDLAKEWHPIKNGNLLPSDVTAGCNKMVWWLYSYDDPKTGKHFDFEWESIVANRVKGNGCPYLSGQQIYKGFNDLATTHPELAKEWHSAKNGSLNPSDVTKGSEKEVWWLLPYDDPKIGKHFDFEWKATIGSRVQGCGCPYLSGHQVYKGFNDLATTHPEIAKEWHPTKNGSLTPSNVTAGSHQKVWWLLPYDDLITGNHFDFEWKAQIGSRVQGCGCPYLSASKTEQLLYTYCKDNQIVFIPEKKFVDAYWVQFYPFDLYLSWHNLILEADGMQHFENNAYFYSTEKEFQDRVRTDNLKNKYCLEKGIPILRIPYTYDAVVDKDKIETMVSEFIKTRIVHQEILDFYKPFKKRIGSNYYDVAVELNKRATAALAE